MKTADRQDSRTVDVADDSRCVLENMSSGDIVARQAEVARGPLARGLGLMGRRDWSRGDALVLEHCNSIHTFFMRLAIDVVFLDREGIVLRVARSVAPWRVGPIVRRARTVVELPAGAASGINTGDRLIVR